jgi:hypothetical protein
MGSTFADDFLTLDAAIVADAEVSVRADASRCSTCFINLIISILSPVRTRHNRGSQ